MNAIQIRNSIQSINKRERDIDEFEKRTLEIASDWIKEIALQGQELIQLKSSVEHGEWLPLFDSGRIRTPWWKARIYMRVAENYRDLDNLKAAKNLWQVAGLLSNGEPLEQSNKEEKEPQRWPGHIEGLTRASKFISFVERHPITKWPRENIDRLKEQLLPIARQLWPDGLS